MSLEIARRAVAEHVEHYHAERNHQGIGSRLIFGPSVSQMTTCVRRRRRIGGLFDFYQRAA
jgi:putative transposase